MTWWNEERWRTPPLVLENIDSVGVPCERPLRVDPARALASCSGSGRRLAEDTFSSSRSGRSINDMT